MRHKRTVHGQQGGKQYIHEKSHTGERPEKQFACEECKYTTNTKAYLKDHIRRMHLVRGVGWMCVEGTCENKPKTFVNNRLLLQHKKDHQNLLCPSCTKTFNSKRNLNRHRKVVHKPEQPNIERRLLKIVESLHIRLWGGTCSSFGSFDELIKTHSLWIDWSSL